MYDAGCPNFLCKLSLIPLIYDVVSCFAERYYNFSFKNISLDPKTVTLNTHNCNTDNNL